MSSGFPILNASPSKTYLYEVYGDWWAGAITRTVGTTVSGTTYNVGSVVVPYGFRAKVTGFVIKSSFGGKWLGYMSRGSVNWAEPQPKVINNLEYSFPAGGGSIILPWVPDVDFLEGGLIDLKITANEATSGNTVSIMPIGQLISNDTHTDAQNVVDVWGDSITWQIGGNISGGTLPNLGYSHYAARICSQLRTLGIDVWRNNKGFGGANTQNLVDAMYGGFYGRPNAEWKRLKMVILGIGINDAATGSASSTGYVAKMKLLLDYIYKHAPTCAVLLMGQTPVDPTDTNRTLYVQSYRDAMLALTTDSDYTGKEIKYVDTTTNFTVTAANYTDTAPMLHPRWDTGGLIIYNNAMPVVNTFNFVVNR
jgi:hypothetical protein